MQRASQIIGRGDPVSVVTYVKRGFCELLRPDIGHQESLLHFYCQALQYAAGVSYLVV